MYAKSVENHGLSVPWLIGLGVIVINLFNLIHAVAQSTTANIEGYVTDPQGAVIVGARVTARNVATNLERSTVTNASGLYSLRLLPIGTYELTVEAEGFQTEVLKGITLEIDQTARIDIELPVGTTTETITVTAAPPITETANATIGEVIENRRITELPLNGRNFQQLALLTAGTTAAQEGGTQGFFGTAGGGIGFVIHGGRDDQNNFLVDGINVMDHYFNSITLTPSIDAIQEFKVLQNSYSAEAGMFGSGQINISTKSGTNEFHGTVFEFLRNDKLDAKNFFDLPDRPIPPFRQNQFGFSLGGPVVKDRTFFFTAYEGLRIRQDQTRLSALPTIYQRQGLFLEPIIDPETGELFPTVGVDGQTFYRIPPERFGVVARTIIERFFPVPNLRPTEPGLNHVSVDTRKEDRDQVVVRIDHRFSEAHQFFGRYIWARSDQLFPFGDNILTFDPPPPPGFGTPVEDDSQNLALGWTWVVSSTKVNELRLGWNFYDGKRTAENKDVNFARLVGVDMDIAERDRGFPAFTLAGISQFGDSDVFNPLFRKNNIYQISDNFSWTVGRHSLKFGGDFRHIRFDTLSNFFTRGFAQFQGGVWATGNILTGGNVVGSPIADFLLDRPFANIRLRGDTTGNFRTNLYGIYFNDEFRVSPRFTITYGVRYEVFPPIHEINNRLAVFDDRTGNIIIAGDRLPPEVNGELATQYDALLAALGLPPVNYVTADSMGLNEAIVKTDFGNIAPRIGIAYDLTGSGRTVLRAAYGIFNALRDWSAPSDSRNILPFTAQTVFVDFARFGVPIPPITYADAYTQIGNQLIGGIGPQVEMPIGYTQQYTVNLQHAITANLGIEIAYVGVTGVNLNRLTTSNQEFIGTGIRPFPNFSFFIQEDSGVNSSYHSAFVRVEKRMSQGLAFTASYTFSKSLDTASSARENGGAPTREQDAYNRAAEKALSNFDVRHRFVASFVYDLPWGPGRRYGGNLSGVTGKLLEGWQLGGIVTLRSGQPFTPQFPGGTVAGFRFPRPDVIRNPNLPSDQRDPARWFDAGAFREPPLAVEAQALIPGSHLPGNAGRNILEGPGFKNVDFTLQKVTSLGESVDLQFRAEFFNIFNHPNFDLPDRNFVPGPGGVNANPNFGVVTSAKNSRQIQFGLKLIF